MDKNFRVFDFHRIFIGDYPPMFYLEIVFRTIIMYSYTILLLRFLGKRGMGQLSTLELAIIVSFGTAIGDPMIGADAPIFHGMVAVTVIAIFQSWLERLINKNKKVEALMEGEPRLMVSNGIIQWSCMIQENLSKEDLFRFLRDKEVEHLGQVHKALFEISGNVSVMFYPPKNVKPGLTVLPDNTIPDRAFLSKGTAVYADDSFSCINCGYTIKLKPEDILPECTTCRSDKWLRAVK